MEEGNEGGFRKHWLLKVKKKRFNSFVVYSNLDVSVVAVVWGLQGWIGGCLTFRSQRMKTREDSLRKGTEVGRLSVGFLMEFELTGF